MKPFVLHAEAEKEFEEAIQTYEAQRTGRGSDFRAAVDKAIRAIQKNPRMHAQYKNTDYRKCVVQRFPYVMYYMDLDAVIWIAAVAHGKRRPGYWMSRTPGD